MGNKVRYRSINNVLKEIKYNTEEYCINQLHFMDETFTLNKKRVISLCNQLINEKVFNKLKWIGETRVNLVDKDLLLKLKESGCSHIIYGIESGNDKILRIIKKGITIKQSENAIKLTKEAGIEVIATLILGHPYETRKTIDDSIKFAVNNDIDFAVFAILTPFPGTEIFKMAKKGEGNLKILTNNWNDYSKQMGNALSLKNIPRKELDYLQTLAYMRFYLRPNKISNLLKITNLKAIPVYALKKLKIFA